MHHYFDVLKTTHEKINKDPMCIYLSNYMFIHPSICYQTWVCLLTAQKPIIERQMSVEGKGALIKKAYKWEEGGLRSETTSQDYAWSWLLLKGKGYKKRDTKKKRKEGKNLQESLRQQVGSWILLHGVQTLTFLSDIFLPMWIACRIAKGAVGDR